MTETIDKTGNEKLDVKTLKLEVSSGIEERKSGRVLENKHVSMMTDDNKPHGYYILKLDRPPHELQEDNEIF